MRSLHSPPTIAPMPLAPAKRAPWLPILRPGCGASVEAVILSSQPFPCGTHFFPAGSLKDRPTTLPHTAPVCECFGCRCKRELRPYAYLIGFVQPVSRQFIVELTPGALSQLERDYALVRPTWRGLTVRLTRKGKSAQGPVRAMFPKVPREPEDGLLLPYSIEEALWRIWGPIPEWKEAPQ